MDTELLAIKEQKSKPGSPKYGSTEQEDSDCDSSDSIYKAQSIYKRYLNLWNLSTTWSLFTGFNVEVTLCCNLAIYWTWIWIVFHIINCGVTLVMFVSHPPNPHKPWCSVYEINVILLQCQSCILYLCTFYIMKDELFIGHLSCVSKYHKDNHKFCFRANCLGWLSVLIVSVTEFVQAGDPHGWKFGPHGQCLEFTLACFDTWRFFQCVVTFFFIYGMCQQHMLLICIFMTSVCYDMILYIAYLDGFKQAFNEFIESHFEGTTQEELDQVIEIGDVSMTKFKKDYHEMTKRFKVFIEHWEYFITLYGILNGISVILLCIAIIKNYLGIGCNLPATYLIHSTSETSFQFIYGLLLGFKLNCNHNLIPNYKEKFQKWVIIKNLAAMSCVQDFLENESAEGPFAIWTIPPSNQILIIFASTCFIPTVLHIWSYFNEK